MCDVSDNALNFCHQPFEPEPAIFLMAEPYFVSRALEHTTVALCKNYTGLILRDLNESCANTPHSTDVSKCRYRCGTAHEPSGQRDQQMPAFRCSSMDTTVPQDGLFVFLRCTSSGGGKLGSVTSSWRGGGRCHGRLTIRSKARQTCPRRLVRQSEADPAILLQAWQGCISELAWSFNGHYRTHSTHTPVDPNLIKPSKHQVYVGKAPCFDLLVNTE